MTTGISDKVLERLKGAELRLDEINGMLSDPAVASDGKRLRDLHRERGDLHPLVSLYQEYKGAQAAMAEAKDLADDPVLKQVADEEIEAAKNSLADIEEKLLVQLQPKDPDDNKNCFLEIRAGTGGLESCLFANDLLRMYTRWGERNKLSFDTVSSSPGDAGGFKELIAKVEGQNANALLKHEAGAHRVQRIPETESQGRVHTSVCTVAVMPEVEMVDIGIDPSDLRVDTYKSSGAGGQHVNTTDSAVRITHLPTGIVAECQENRSQHRNRDRAMEMLVARVNNHFRLIQDAEQKDSRRKMVGSGERHEKIRTYNYPQGRVTDHRVNLTVRRLKEIMDGDLQEIYQALRQAEKAEQIEEFSITSA